MHRQRGLGDGFLAGFPEASRLASITAAEAPPRGGPTLWLRQGVLVAEGWWVWWVW